MHRLPEELEPADGSDTNLCFSLVRTCWVRYIYHSSTSYRYLCLDDGKAIFVLTTHHVEMLQQPDQVLPKGAGKLQAKCAGFLHRCLKHSPSQHHQADEEDPSDTRSPFFLTLIPASDDHFFFSPYLYLFSHAADVPFACSLFADPST